MAASVFVPTYGKRMVVGQCESLSVCARVFAV